MNDSIDRVRRGFQQQGFMRLIGADLVTISDGQCEIGVSWRDELLQQHGYYHGGVVATLADNAGGFAAQTLMSEREQPLSVEFKINFVAKATGDRLVARAMVKKRGRSLKVCYVEVFGCSEDQERLCAMAIVSVMTVPADAVGGNP